MNNNFKTFNALIEYLKETKEVISILLGGSRSKNTFKPDSDFDVFIIVDPTQFDVFAEIISLKLENDIPDLVFFGKDKYLEDWGYMYCGIDYDGNFYDLAFIPLTRLKEMSLRTNNLVLFDRSGTIVSHIKNTTDVDYKCVLYLGKKLPEVIRSFYINYVRYIKNYKKDDYWMAFRFLYLLRDNLMKCERIINNRPSKLFFLSEENYEIELISSTIRNNFIIDGTFETLNSTMRAMIIQYKKYFPSDEIINRIETIYEFKI